MRNGEPMEFNFEGLEIQKWNIPTDRAQQLDEKNGVICLVIMFTPRVMVFEMSKTAHCLYFLLIKPKISHSLGKIFKWTWKILLGSCRKWYD